LAARPPFSKAADDFRFPQLLQAQKRLLHFPELAGRQIAVVELPGFALNRSNVGRP
jgi:hypothetical protein